MPDLVSGPVQLTVDDAGIGRLVLARPETGNALDLTAAEAIAAAVRTLERTVGLRAVLISAEGRAFTVGGDLRYVAAHFDDLAEAVAGLLAHYHAALPRLAALAVPVVAAVQGAAAGGGLGLLWVADVVVAADDLQIVTGFDKLGLSGDGGSSWHLPRLVGLRRAQHMLLTGRPVRAAEALEWGLVSRVVPAADLAAEAEAEVGRLAAGPTAALGRMKRLLLQSPTTGYADQLAAEGAAMAECATTDDVRAGVTAFLDRRRPTFTGR